MSATIREIVTEAQSIVGEVDGAGVQTYSDDRMFRDAVRCFNLVVKKYEWQQYTEWSEHTLDGALGIVDAAAFTTVRDFEDFLHVKREDEEDDLPILPRNINPYKLSGSTVLYWTALPVTDENYAARRLQFWPKEATGIVQVQARVYPESPLDWATVFYLDKDMLAYGTAFMTLIGDDLNPGAAEANRLLMEMRFNDITTGLARRPIGVSHTGNIPTDWYQS